MSSSFSCDNHECQRIIDPTNEEFVTSYITLTESASDAVLRFCDLYCLLVAVIAPRLEGHGITKGRPE